MPLLYVYNGLFNGLVQNIANVYSIFIIYSIRNIYVNKNNNIFCYCFCSHGENKKNLAITLGPIIFGVLLNVLYNTDNAFKRFQLNIGNVNKHGKSFIKVIVNLRCKIYIL